MNIRIKFVKKQQEKLTIRATNRVLYGSNVACGLVLGFPFIVVLIIITDIDKQAYEILIN
jgi:hypothetical protein